MLSGRSYWAELFDSLERHERQHCSMLVNASRFMNVQGQLRNEIHAKLDNIQRSIRVNGALPPQGALLDPELKALYEIWKREFLQHRV